MFVNGIVIKCAGCGAPLSLEEGKRIATCECCGNVNTIPVIKADRQADFERAKDYRRAGEFDRAFNLYTDILKDVGDSAELYWEILLSKYGVIFVEDYNTHEMMPTIQRMQTASIITDQDFLMAIKYATPEEAEIYNKTVEYISDIQKNYIEIINSEEPYDIFICYKETDENGDRTIDSTTAESLYNDLTDAGYRVFFSRISLEDKLGKKYEPYIYAALHSAKVMILVTTKKEYLESSWVKNEWKRFLSMQKEDNSKELLSVYSFMKPEDLPGGGSQAQDFSKYGFKQDILRNIKKIIPLNEKNKGDEIDISYNPIESNLRRAEIELETGMYTNVDIYAEKVLDYDPENATAHLYLLLSQYGARNLEDLIKINRPLSNSIYFERLLNFSDDEELKIELKYAEAMILYRNGKYEYAKKYFSQVLEHKNSAEMIDKCIEAENKIEERKAKENKINTIKKRLSILAKVMYVLVPFTLGCLFLLFAGGHNEVYFVLLLKISTIFSISISIIVTTIKYRKEEIESDEIIKKLLQHFVFQTLIFLSPYIIIIIVLVIYEICKRI